MKQLQDPRVALRCEGKRGDLVSVVMGADDERPLSCGIHREHMSVREYPPHHVRLVTVLLHVSPPFAAPSPSGPPERCCLCC